MTDDSKDSDDLESLRAVEGDSLDDDFAAPGRSVFGDDDVSFDDDDDAVPHWSEPPTGSIPKVGGTAEAVTFDPTPGPTLQEAEPDELAAWSNVSNPKWADDESELADVMQIGEESETADDFFAFDDEVKPSRLGVAAEASAEPSIAAQLGTVSGTGSGRDMPMAVIVGVGLAALILAAMSVGPVAALVVVTIFLGLAAVEFYNAVRVAGHQPAVLLGLTSVVTMPLAVYWRGEAAMTLVVVLSLVFGALWYLMGVSTDGVIRGLGSTMIGILHIGLLGSFAALMLSIDTYGTGLLTASILLTVAYDVGGLAIGRTMGRTPLSDASPNKTIEGLVGGMAATLGAAIVMGMFVGQPAPFAASETGGGTGDMILLGVAVAFAAPIGDLAESMIKRDLGVKDMGSILPGHGGLLDRFDGLLFVLPTTWYVANAVLFT